MDYDTILRELTIISAKVYPQVTLRFSASYNIKQDGVFFVSVTRDSGDRLGEVLFAQGTGSTCLEAAQQLAGQFLDLLKTKNEASFKEMTAVLERHSKTTAILEEAMESVKALTLSSDTSLTHE